MFDIDYRYVDELYELDTQNFEVERSTPCDYHRLHEIFDDRYNTGNFEFSFDLSCSDLIETLFKRYVSPDTIVISSKRDHPSVQKCLESFECKELILLDDGEYLEGDFNPDPRLFRNSKDFSINKLANRLSIKNYKNIFFISYGTNVCDGEVRNNNFFHRIIKVCKMNCDSTVSVLDDCQGSMWIDRDYSLFDYVLWTAHATLLWFDTGILLTKKGMPVLGVHNVGEEFLYDNYKRLQEKKSFVTSFSKQLSLATGVHLSQAPHLFCVKLNKDFPEGYFIDKQKEANVSEIVNIKIEANRFARLRVEYFMNVKNKYLMLRALRYIAKESESISEDNFLP